MVESIIQFIKDNAVWVVPIIIAFIGGLFALIKRQTTSSIRQNVKNVDNSNITQIGRDQNIQK